MIRCAKPILIAVIATYAAFACFPAYGETVGVAASVPAYCEIDPSVLVAEAGDGAATGSVFESCNTQEGFRIAAQHRALAPVEHVVFDYAGERTELGRDGWSVVANRKGAKLGSRAIGLQYSGLITPLSISLSITAM